jgi:hypothetical protein
MWRPIETAPRDGRKVLLCEIKNGEYEEWPETFYWDGDWYAAIDGCSLTISHTHWQPLPAPPEIDT